MRNRRDEFEFQPASLYLHANAVGWSWIEKRHNWASVLYPASYGYALEPERLGNGSFLPMNFGIAYVQQRTFTRLRKKKNNNNNNKMKNKNKKNKKTKNKKKNCRGRRKISWEFNNEACVKLTGSILNAESGSMLYSFRLLSFEITYRFVLVAVYTQDLLSRLR